MRPSGPLSCSPPSSRLFALRLYLNFFYVYQQQLTPAPSHASSFRYIENIIRTPTDKSFRIIRISNSKFQANVGRFDGAIELMQVHTPSSRMRYDNM